MTDSIDYRLLCHVSSMIYCESFLVDNILKQFRIISSSSLLFSVCQAVTNGHIVYVKPTWTVTFPMGSNDQSHRAA
jgi:hypothetical protein